MRLSRVLLAGAAVATAGIATSAFTASNNFAGVDNNVAGYGELVATGVTVNNIAYNPAPTDATRLRSVVFTVAADIPNQTARMSLFSGTTPTPASASTCAYSLSGASDHLITCTLTADVLFTAFDKTGLTVTSN